jgi:hypothetical protein
MSTGATAVVAMDKVVHFSCNDEHESSVYTYRQLYQARMAGLCLRSRISLHLINPDDNDPLLMDILFAYRCAVHGITLPTAFSVESLKARVAEQHRQYS